VGGIGNGAAFFMIDVKDKTVAIIGNAASIFDRLHPDIDSHDVIIRFNKGFITIPLCQGTRTDVVILSLELTDEEKQRFNAKLYINRSPKTKCGDVTISDTFRAKLKEIIGKQPSSGYMAICLCIDAKKIDLYGFDFGKTPTYYNPDGYVTLHDFNKEHELIKRIKKVHIN
jgi:uncharacterized Rossmann fold enzyme